MSITSHDLQKVFKAIHFGHDPIEEAYKGVPMNFQNALITIHNGDALKAALGNVLRDYHGRFAPHDPAQRAAISKAIAGAPQIKR